MKLETMLTVIAAEQGLDIGKFLKLKAMMDAYGDPVLALHSDAFIEALRKAFPLSVSEQGEVQKQIQN